MAAPSEQLVVRQHERQLCQLPGSVVIAPDHANQVILSRTTVDSTGALDARIVDCSRGGLGLETKVFLPRTCRVLVRLKPEGLANAPHDLELSCRVQRVTMLDRTPRYYLGLSFIGQGEAHAARAAQLLAFVNSLQPAAPTTPSAAPSQAPTTTSKPSDTRRAG